MKSGKMTIVAVAGATLVLAAVLVMLGVVDISGKTPAVLLPTAQLTPVQPSAGDVTTLEITPANVQAVVAKLDRAESYSRTITVESLWQGGKAGYNVSVWSMEGCTKAVISRIGSASIKTVILTPEKYFAWDNNESAYYEGPVGVGVPGELADAYQMIPTYEDVLRLDKSRITEASSAVYMGDIYITIKYISENFGYTEIYNISVKTGLLMSADTFDGDTQIYSMSSSAVSELKPQESEFRLPDGGSALAKE